MNKNCLTPYQYEKLCREVWSRDNDLCRVSGVYANGVPPHHIIYKSRGGSDSIDNLILLSNDIHDRLHRNLLKDHEMQAYIEAVIDITGWNLEQVAINIKETRSFIYA